MKDSIILVCVYHMVICAYYVFIIKCRQPTEKISGGDGRPAWMKSLHSTALEWLDIVPVKLETLRRTAENIKDPLFRFF